MPESDNLYYYRPVAPLADPPTIRADVLIYGATVAGVAAAVQLRADGLTPVIAEFGAHLGGVSTSGLSRTDFGRKEAFGGLARSFYQQIGAFYSSPAGRARNAAFEEDGSVWYFEPSIAEAVLQRWIDDNEIAVYYRQPIASVDTSGGAITRVVTEDGTTFVADSFIDSSYEGDLMARAGVSYHVGREGNDESGETANGIQFGSRAHRFNIRVDPYLKPGRPDSGLLPLVADALPGGPGDGDRSVQAYNFRMCLTDDPDNRIPFPAPTDYDPARFELLGRYINAGVFDAMNLNVAMPNRKTDMNNYGAVSTDHIGANYDWPDGDYPTRQRIFADHVSYTMGILHFLQNDDSLPAQVRASARRWGLPIDEFVDTGHWPRQLYIREARRMVGEHVMNEYHARSLRAVEDPVALAAYGIDSHNCRRLLIKDAPVNEGDVQHPIPGPYGIAYRALIPRGEECTNLAVPVCLSATHIAYGSIRMEPVFLALGQSAAAATALSLQSGRPMQDVDYPALRAKLTELGQAITPPS